MQAAAVPGMRPPWSWRGTDRESRVLFAAVGVSIGLHAVALSVHFAFPRNDHWRPSNTPLEVVLVNARSARPPVRGEALAQANLDGGGNTDQNLRAKTPLPATRPKATGRELAEAKRRVQQLEAHQRRLLARTKAAKASVKALPGPPRPEPAASEEPVKRSGRELADLSLAALKLQAQIDRQVQEYQKRPRKQFIGARATEYRFAQYEEDWRLKVERVGTINYPAEARGKLYGNLRLTVTIRPDGSVASIELDRSSGLKVLDNAAHRIVRMAAPYAPFPPDIRRDTDLLVITRTWFFGRGDQVWMK